MAAGLITQQSGEAGVKWIRDKAKCKLTRATAQQQTVNNIKT